jgi:hypothetical protein
LGGRGGAPNFFLLESSYFCYLGAHAKIWNPTTAPSGVLATAVTRKKKEKNLLALMGVLAPGSEHARPSAQPPIDNSGNFPAPVSAEWPSAFKTVPFSGQNRVILGGRGGHPNFFFIGILLFLLLRSPCKNLEPYDNPFGGFSNGGNKKKRKEKEQAGAELCQAQVKLGWPARFLQKYSCLSKNNVCLKDQA